MRIEPGQVLFERWRIDHVVGSGGMGYVLAGQDLFLKRRVAIKCLHPHLAVLQQVHDRFLTEAQVMARIDAPQVVGIYDAFDWQGLPVVVMEYVDGETLGKVLARDPRPPQAFVRAVAEGVLRGLRVAHRAGVIHRDVKPDNIMILYDEDGEVDVRLLDFGVAQVQQELRHTRTGVAVGTVRYMSPEQVRDASRVDQRTDLFSLGVVLWEMLSGQQPWAHAQDDFDLRVAVVKDELRALPPAVAPDLRLLVERLTAKDIAARAEHATDALRLLRGGASTSQGAASSPDQKATWPRSHAAAAPSGSGNAEGALARNPDRPSARAPGPGVAPGAGERERPPQRGPEVAMLAAQAYQENALATWRWVTLPPARFRMGSPSDEVGRAEDERERWVTLSHPFQVMCFPVTVEVWGRVMGGGLATEVQGHLPMVGVSWLDAVRFCNALSEQSRAQPYYVLEESRVGVRAGSQGFRLLTEAEWEYAARAGTGGARYGPIDRVAWWSGNSHGAAQPVGRMEPNAWGLFDMLGNVWEWVLDTYTEQPPAGEDPAILRQEGYRVLRGGSWFNDMPYVRAASRNIGGPTDRERHVGFRIARSVG